MLLNQSTFFGLKILIFNNIKNKFRLIYLFALEQDIQDIFLISFNG